MSNTTIAQKLQLALNNKSEIKSSLIAKGINVGEKMSEWSDAIDNAQIGGVEPIRATFAGSNSEIKIMYSADWYNYGISKLLANDQEVNTTTLPASLDGYDVEYYTLKLPVRAFYNCYDLTSVTIPNSVTSIGDQAFKGCTGLTKAEFASIESLCKIYFSSVDSNPLYYAHHLYINGQEVTDVVIPNSVTSIGQNAFVSCSSLTSVTIPNSVTSIGYSAFYECTGLTSVTIPNSVTSIVAYTFRDCNGLTSVTIPNSVTSIGNQAFDGCSSLTSVTIPNSVTSIGVLAFYRCSSLTKAEFASIESLCKIDFKDKEANPLYYAHHLYINGQEVKDVVIPNSVTSIGGYAFYNCASLRSITIPNSVTSIGVWAFYGCASLRSITIPNSVTSIGGYAFYNCTSLRSITIPNSVTSIGNGVFRYCTSLTSITIPNSVTSIGEYAFSNCYGLTSVTIPNSVTSIGEYFFNECGSLTSVTIPNSVTSIGSYSFRECRRLTSITIPNSVTSIGEYAFSYCYGLTKAEFASIESLCKIDFLNESANPLYYAHHLYINGQEVKDVVIPNSVTSIGGHAFNGCTGLTSITIPNSVTNIDGYAFANCSSIAAIYSDGLQAKLNVSSSKQQFDAESIQSVIDTWQEGGAIQFSLESALDLKGKLIVGEKAHWEGNTLRYGKGGGGYYY